ncbi:FKBP-type peptidyl-prolyl cis-trans isomerase [Robiginitalea sediminis]|uniref:FKBP-type peptidyl-prolyl cis-trans isomerase n=1 Tax=Robiginitalea sediminis TaxID=1982593 RepID=UPI000B4AE2B5|nr:hypothetical protein [Robiginitalea sediminis]
MNLKNLGLGLLAALLLASCRNDDDGILPGSTVPPRDLDEVALENDADIREFLQTHFYNYEEFDNPPAGFDYQIRIDTLAGDNADKTPLIEQMQTEIIQITPEQVGVDQDLGNVAHTLYYLSVRDGVGVSPTIGDSVLVRYQGSYLDGRSFDANPNFQWQELPFFLRGYQEAMKHFSSGTLGSLVVNPDGTSEIDDRGVGLLILPSGLGYFSDTSTGIIAYSPLIFRVDLGLVVEDTDSDGDGIPNIMEDLNNNGYLYDDNTDEAQELQAFTAILRPNFLDTDDDSDGRPTREEIEIDAQGNITFPDSDGDGTPDYLDRDS